MDKRAMRLLSLVVIVAFGMAGCFGNVMPKPVPVPNVPERGDGSAPMPDPGSKPPDPPNPGQPAEPGHPETPKHPTVPVEPITPPGPVQQLNGQVVFADTELPLRAVVHIDNESIPTETGVFSFSVATGPVPYSLRTLMGEHDDTVAHDGHGTKLMRYPAFAGWSRAYFDTLLASFTGLNGPATLRWPRHTSIPVWIEGPADNPEVTAETVHVAWNVFEEWESILNGTITFRRVNTSSQAAGGITVEYGAFAKPNSGTGGTIGQCAMVYTSRNVLVGGQITLAYDSKRMLPSCATNSDIASA